MEDRGHNTCEKSKGTKTIDLIKKVDREKQQVVKDKESTQAKLQNLCLECAQVEAEARRLEEEEERDELLKTPSPLRIEASTGEEPSTSTATALESTIEVKQ